MIWLDRGSFQHHLKDCLQMAAGMKDFVSKPFKLSDVERVIAFLDNNEQVANNP